MPQVFPYIKLEAHTSRPERLIAKAAKLCYGTDEEVYELFHNNNITPKTCRKMVKLLVELEHESPLEHASYTFYLEGVSRALTHQLVRHRIASHSQRSQRYVAHKNFGFIIPEIVTDTDEYKKDMNTIGKMYDKWREKLLSQGATAEQANENARYLLPNACETKILTTMNIRELLHFFHERLCNRAQDEIKHVAERMLKLAYPTAPNLFKYAGPNCFTKKRCNQGKMCCGKLEERLQTLGEIKQ
jgi:thymidylate synthase (FAD)